MNICGIIAEYDPFHTGHARQIQAAQELLGSDCAIVCVISGNWTQRGAPAIIGKHRRAQLALMGGADLVLELPLPYAISSAEWFARGGVSVLDAAGIVTHLCFGSECGDIGLLRRAADCLDSEAYRQALRGETAKGLSFPAARQNAAAQLIGSGADCLSAPNNNLGVEYLRALAWRKCAIEPVTILRQGAGHGEDARGGYASATYLRTLLRNGRMDEAAPYLIDREVELLYSSQLADFSNAERAVLYRLRQMSVDELAALPDCGEGLSNRLYRAIRESASVEEILTAAKSKRYTHARLRRILLWAYLGMTLHDRPDAPPYLRILGMNGTGRELLRAMQEKASLPVLTKPAHVRQLPAGAQRLFELEAQAADLYSLCLPQPEPCGREWTQSPVIHL